MMMFQRELIRENIKLEEIIKEQKKQIRDLGEK